MLQRVRISIACCQVVNQRTDLGMKATDESIDTSSRRDALQRGGVGIATTSALLAAETAAAQGGAANAAPTRPSGVQDPRELYPKPPFPPQQQPRQSDDPASRPRRAELRRLGTTRWPQGVDHRR
jgi:hypothetical protein